MLKTTTFNLQNIRGNLIQSAW